MPSYKDFFKHVEQSAKKEERERSREETLRRVSEKLAERLGTSPVQALQMVQEKLSSSPKKAINEWMEASSKKKSKRKKSVDKVVGRLKDEADAPSVGDKVRIEYDREPLTPSQEKINGSEGKVAVRDPFSKGSQRARYTVEITSPEEDMPPTVNNLLPGEVVPVEE